jgi:hypothetical protein
VGWRRKPVDGKHEVHTAGEFESADKLDNDVPSDAEGVKKMEQALERLRARHLAFRKADPEEERSLEDLRLRILTEVTADSQLEEYYKEAWGQLPHGFQPTEPPTPAAMPHRRIAVMQIELMIRAFYVLQLQLFANAPENLGWMTLFRHWGNSRRFNAVFHELAPTLPPEFTKFYSLYVETLPTWASATGHLPIHHPWLTPEKARGRGLYMDSGRVEPEVDVRPGTAGVADQRGNAGADQPFERPSDGGDAPGGSHTPNE